MAYMLESGSMDNLLLRMVAPMLHQVVAVLFMAGLVHGRKAKEIELKPKLATSAALTSPAGTPRGLPNDPARGGNIWQRCEELEDAARQMQAQKDALLHERMQAVADKRRLEETVAELLQDNERMHNDLSRSPYRPPAHLQLPVPQSDVSHHSSGQSSVPSPTFSQPGGMPKTPSGLFLNHGMIEQMRQQNLAMAAMSQERFSGPSPHAPSLADAMTPGSDARSPLPSSRHLQGSSSFVEQQQTGLELELEQAKVQRAALEEELTAKQEQLEISQAQVGSPPLPSSPCCPKLCSWNACCSGAAFKEEDLSAKQGQLKASQTRVATPPGA
eukprot:jgi/Astpho2/9631/Aster-03901